jgi:hypothetical protein
MGKNTFKTLILIGGIFILMSFAARAQVLGTACEPYGSISISDEPAADNLPVVAYIDGEEFARCLTLGGQYSLIVPMDNPDTAEKDGWEEGDNILIKVNGSETAPLIEAQQGRIRHDIVIHTLSVRLDTWGKIKALFR